MKRKSIKFDNEEIFLNISRYVNNNRLAILAETKDDYYGDITINLPESPLNTDLLVAIDSYCKSSGLEDKLIEMKIIDSVFDKVKYNYGTYDVVVLNLEKLNEYDPEGFEKYIVNEQEEEDEKELEGD